MGSIRFISSIAATVTLGALFGRRGRGRDHGEATSSLTSLPPPPLVEHGQDLAAVDQASAEVQQAGRSDAPGRGEVRAGSHADLTGDVRPVAHPIRPWELWHPAAEPVRLFQHDPEERVSWREISEGDEPSGTGADPPELGAIDLRPTPVDDVWSAHDPAVTPTAPDDLGTLLDRSRWARPDRSDDDIGDDERFGFGRLRPFTSSVLGDPGEGLGSPPDQHRSGEAGHPGTASAPADVGETRPAIARDTADTAPSEVSTSDDGDVLFRELVSPERMTASEHALEDQGTQASSSLLINGPVTRRTDRDQDRGRRRLPAGLRAAGGEGDRPPGT